MALIPARSGHRPDEAPESARDAGYLVTPSQALQQFSVHCEPVEFGSEHGDRLHEAAGARNQRVRL